MGDRLADELIEILDGINCAKIRNDRLILLYQSCFNPYLNGQEEYELCLNDFKQRMQLYLTE